MTPRFFKACQVQHRAALERAAILQGQSLQLVLRSRHLMLVSRRHMSRSK